jgi:myo-inositol catabolism protein IolH
VKLALDPQMFYATHSVLEPPDFVARMGYSWMELSPEPTSSPSSTTPGWTTRGDGALWTSASPPCCRCCVGPAPARRKRQAAVRAWKRAIEITVDLGVELVNSEFNGRPEAAKFAESQFLRSMDELIPSPARTTSSRTATRR